MNFDELKAACDKAKSAGSERITLNLPNKAKLPPKFPRGELLSATERGRNFSFPIANMLIWIEWAKKETAAA